MIIFQKIMKKTNTKANFSIISILSFFILFKISKSDVKCNKTHPILKDGNCVSTYCSEEEFKNSECIINNDIIKTQWLSNIIQINENQNRFVHPFLTKDNDLIIQTTSLIYYSQKRNYYGLTKEGRYFFTDSRGEEYPYFSIEAQDGEILYKSEGIATAVQFENDNNDYFLSVGIYPEYAELIDYKGKTISRKLTEEFYYVPVVSEVSSIFLMTKTPVDLDKKKYYIVSFLIYWTDGFYYFMCKIYYFNSTNINNGYERVVNKNYLSANRRITSCFQSPTSLLIFCFYQSDAYNFHIIVYEPNLDLDEKTNKIIDSGDKSEGNIYIFFKGVCLLDNVGFYLYYKSINSLPYIAIKEYGTEIVNYRNYGGFTLDHYTFNANLHLNDIIKIKSSQICFTSVDNSKEILYIALFIFYSDYSKMMIRYYKIDLYQIYHKKVFFDLKLTEFGNYLTISSSMCLSTECSSNSNDHYSFLIIFGYPNSADVDFDLIQYLNETNQDLNNMNIILHKYINTKAIENNIFGYVYKGIKILSVPDSLNIKSNELEIKQDYYLQENENISISISIENQNEKDEYIIKYALVYSDPDYSNLYDYVDFYVSKTEESDYYSDEFIEEYIGRTAYFKIIKNGILSTNCENEECLLCKQEGNNNVCIKCQGIYNIVNNEKICKLPDTTEAEVSTVIQPDITTEKAKETNIVSENSFCSNIEIINNECHENITNQQIEEIYDELLNILNNSYLDDDMIIITENVAFQLSYLSQQKEDNEHLFISSIDLGQCEKVLKEKEHLDEEDDLIILKTDIKSDDFQITYIQYDIFHPYTKAKLDLDICQNISVYIYSPSLLSSEDKSIYESLNISGYNLYDLTDSFYSDICSTFTSKEGTDIPMNNRRKEIYDIAKKYSMCQNNCTFLYLNTSNDKAKCECSVQTEDTITDKNDINFKYEIVGNFYSILKNSNFLILKCYKLVFSLKGQINNIGSYIMIVINFSFIILIVLYSILERDKINKIIQSILSKRKILSEDDNYKNKTKFKKGKKKGKNNKKNIIFSRELNGDIKNPNKSLINKNKLLIKKNKKEKKENNNPPLKNKLPNTKNKINSKKNYGVRSSFSKEINNKLKENSSSSIAIVKKRPLETNINSLTNKIAKVKIKILNNNINNNNKKLKNKNSKFKKNINIDNNIEIFKKSVPFSTVRLIKENKKLNKIENENNNKINNKILDLNDQELNGLEYKQAIKIDKRSYFQYYYSLLKPRNLFLFAFFPSNDYNLKVIKISLLLISFSLNFAINAFFFTDKSMNNVYKNKGKFDILFQIPQIIFSSIIPSIIFVILKKISLSEPHIISFKTKINSKDIFKTAKNLEKCLKIRFLIFFIVSFPILIFFWYYISCFCAVYKNTQLILIEDTFISFGISIIYPFGLCLLPGLFRFPALKDSQGNKKCLYLISYIMTLLF